MKKVLTLKTFSLLLVLTLIMSAVLCACGGTEVPGGGKESGESQNQDTQSESSASETEKETEPGEESETSYRPDPASSISLIQGQKTYFKVVYPQSYTYNFETSLVESFQAEFEKRLGAAIESKTDKREASETAKEIVIGRANRPLTAKLCEDLEKAGGYRYGIYVEGNTVAVCGTNLYTTYLGLCELFDAHIYQDASGKTNLILENDLRLISDEVMPYPDVEQAAATGTKLAFYLAETVIEVPSVAPNVGGKIRMFATLQGGGTDGTYIYCIMCNNESGVYPYVMIYKFDAVTYKQVQVSDPIYMGHANDLTYDPVNNRLIISDCTSDTDWCGLYFVDRDSLTLIDTQLTAFHQCALEYLPDRNGYVYGNGDGTEYTVNVTDAEFNSSRTFVFPQRDGLIDQGLTTDGRFIFAPMYNKTGPTQYVHIAELDRDVDYGVFPLYNVPDHPDEPEFMYVLNGELYMGFNGDGDLVGRVVFVPEGWFSAVTSKN